MTISEQLSFLLNSAIFIPGFPYSNNTVTFPLNPSKTSNPFTKTGSFPTSENVNAAIPEQSKSIKGPVDITYNKVMESPSFSAIIRAYFAAANDSFEPSTGIKILLKYLLPLQGRLLSSRSISYGWIDTFADSYVVKFTHARIRDPLRR